MRKYAVVFVHGLAKKPPLTKLEEIWRWGLSRPDPNGEVFPNPNPGIDLDVEGVPALFNYYADVFYAEDYETEFGSYYEAESAVVLPDNLDAVAGELQPPQPANERERRFLVEFERKMSEQPTPPTPPSVLTAPAVADAAQFEIASWLPGPVKQAVIRKAAMEAYYFLFDKEYQRENSQPVKVRHELRQRLLDVLRKAGQKAEKTVLVTHSMGTMVAYDVLRNCPDCPPVDTLFTLGSPLGIQEVQDELVASGKDQVDFPAATLRRWINIYDPLDPVCGADPRFASDFREVDGKRVEDFLESNWGSWRHTITHYLAGKQLRACLAEALEVQLR
ncbi:hypothetical protein AA309_07160 [Microvirga vignae]|uniref:Uncharacterized protein n=1 Tax=Microvirga vignae TaxID=1225564 RepID=A0A0H1RFE6_9HYPH|nr:hypothetical protein [Microvirga vignae]KLK93794.1 hypothetical protein AA309_07160 [Microvirga vignae]